MSSRSEKLAFLFCLCGCLGFDERIRVLPALSPILYSLIWIAEAHLFFFFSFSFPDRAHTELCVDVVFYLLPSISKKELSRTSKKKESNAGCANLCFATHDEDNRALADELKTAFFFFFLPWSTFMVLRCTASLSVLATFRAHFCRACLPCCCTCQPSFFFFYYFLFCLLPLHTLPPPPPRSPFLTIELSYEKAEERA